LQQALTRNGDNDFLVVKIIHETDVI